MTSNILLNAALMIPLAHAGLALATSLAAWINAGLLFYLLCRTNIYNFQPGWNKFTLQMVLANIVLVIFCYLVSPTADIWLGWHWQSRLWHLMVLLTGALVCYFGTLRLSGMRWQEFKRLS